MNTTMINASPISDPAVQKRHRDMTAALASARSNLTKLEQERAGHGRIDAAREQLRQAEFSVQVIREGMLPSGWVGARSGTLVQTREVFLKVEQRLVQLRAEHKKATSELGKARANLGWAETHVLEAPATLAGTSRDQITDQQARLAVLEAEIAEVEPQYQEAKTARDDQARQLQEARAACLAATDVKEAEWQAHRAWQIHGQFGGHPLSDHPTELR